MRESESYRRSRSALSLLSLVLGYSRPSASSLPWGMQQPAMPGDLDAPIVATAAGVAPQMQRMFEARHPMDDLSSRLHQDVDAAIRWQCNVFSAGRSVHESRMEAWSTFSQCARDLEGWSRQLAECSPDFISSSTPPFPHYALFECAIDALELPDERLPEDLVCGAPCVGDIPDSGNFKLFDDPSAVEVDDLDHREWNARLVEDLTRAGRDPAQAGDHVALWERTSKEVSDGFVVPIGDLSAARTFFHGDGFRASGRFGVLQKGKLRPCENCRRALHNLATTLAERLVNESADYPARVASLYAEILGGAMFSMLIGTEDVASAYRRMPCSQPWFTVFAQWDPHLERVVFFRLQGFNFGLKSAPNQFNRLSFCMARFAARLLRVASGQYFDDFCVTEPSFARGGQQLLRDMAATLGVPFDGAFIGDGKSESPAEVGAYLGVEHDFRAFRQQRYSLASVPRDRILELWRAISSILEASSFDAVPGGAPKLTGRLHFCLSWGCRRFGRAALQPLHASRHSSSFAAPLRTALAFLRDLLVDPATLEPRLRPRRFDYASSRRNRLPTVLVWSDARWEQSHASPAGIGFVVFFPDSEEAADAARRSYSPPWMDGGRTPPGEWLFAAYDLPLGEISHWRERSQYIGQLELLAAIAVYYSLADRLRDRKVIHCVDNSGSMACLIKDYSADLDSAALVHSFWALAVGIGVDVWFVFVNSEANVADWPSRGLTSFAADLAADRVEGPALRLPPRAQWGDVEAALSHTGSAGPAPAPAHKRRRRL